VPPTESFSNRQEEQAALDTVNMHYARRWQQLNENLRRMARRSGGKNEPFHIIAANNLYVDYYGLVMFRAMSIPLLYCCHIPYLVVH